MNTYAYQGDPADPAAITAFEEKIGATLPDDFRAFLGAINGGQPAKGAFPVQWSGQEWAEFLDTASASELYGLRDDDGLSLEDELESMEERIPAGSIPVGNDPGGSLILLFVKGGQAGGVYFWAQEYEADFEGGEVPDFRNVGFIAPSFGAFLELIAQG